MLRETGGWASAIGCLRSVGASPEGLVSPVYSSNHLKGRYGSVYMVSWGQAISRNHTDEVYRFNHEEYMIKGFLRRG